MRDLINLVEDSGTVKLYRGDGSEVERFQLAKTDEGALFGIGIYLTDDAEVAKDYTVSGAKAGDGNVIFPPAKMRRDGAGFHDLRELTAAFIRHLLNDDRDFSERVDALKTEWQNKYYDLNGKIDWSGDHDEARAERDRIQQHIQDGFAAERSKLIRTAVAKAKKDYAAIRPAMRVAKLTTGEMVFTKPKRDGRLSTFEIPTAYIGKCLNVEEPVSDELLKIIKDAFTRVHPKNDPEGVWDLRTRNPESRMGDEVMGQSFDQFIQNFRDHGARYAWTADWQGGNGKNPSLNFIWNGTHSGYHAFQHNRVNQQNLIDALKPLGYVGFVYAGGVQTSGSGAHGGGGHYHNAYVFWDEDAIASFRVSSEPLTDPEIEDKSKGLRSDKIYW